MHPSIRMEQQAHAHMKRQEYAQAAEIFRHLVVLHPDYEHGRPHYDLACCLEELGKFDEARTQFLRALEANPRDLLFCGGLASFLFSHGSHQEAFDAYVHFMAVAGAGSALCQTARPALLALAKLIDVTEKEAYKRVRVAEERQQCSR